MSIYASWPSVGEYDEDHPDCGHPDGTILTYMRSHVYPDAAEHPPASVGIAHIPGFIWADRLPEERREQGEDDPVAPNLRRTSAVHRACLACGRASAYFRASDPRFEAEANWQYQRIMTGKPVRHIRPYKRAS